jgi:prepilin-type processing-associated H-X9-DG protein
MADNSNPPPLPNMPNKTSGLAITSLVLGILGLFSCGATALFGLVFGIIALTSVKRSGGTLKGDGIALAGIIVSAIFLLMIPIFAAMLLPALAAAKQRAQTINCVSNEKVLAMAVRIYANEHTNHFPPAATWCDAIKTHTGDSERVFKCPAVATGASRCDYGFNAALDGTDESKVNPQTVMLFESDGGWNANGGSESMATPARHQNGHVCVVAFADGSVQEIRESQVNNLRWNP